MSMPDFFKRTIPAWELNPATGKWIRVPKAAAPTAVTPKSKFSLLTYNIWFQKSYYFFERNQHIFQYILQKKPDVVCLQECTEEMMAQFAKTCPELSATYRCSCCPVQCGAYMNGYNVVMLVSCEFFEVSEFQLLMLPTIFGRRMVGFEFAEKSFGLATVHLESLDQAQTRREQLKIIKEQFLSKYEHSLLCGDFNFDSDKNYNENDGQPLENNNLSELLPEFSDLWAQLHPNERGLTYDSSVNKNIQNEEKQMRIDRIILASKHWHCTSIERVGTEPFIVQNTQNNEDVQVWMSDHFGLLATIEQ